jgi:hypothetical protein
MEIRNNNILYALFLIALCIFLAGTTNAQDVLWVKQGTSPGFENGNAIVADDSGNVYVTGQIEFTSVFDTYSIPVYGQHDVLVAKYNSQGIIQWIRKAGGPSGDIGNGIGIDSTHNVYVTGEIEETAQFGSGISVTSEGANDIFVAKYDVNGNILWAKGFGSDQGSDKGRAMVVSKEGNCYITGNFTNTTEFDSHTLNTNGGNDIFITKINTDGDVLWAKKAGGSSQDRGYGIALDAFENVYVTGTFTQSATLKNTTITNPGNNSTFLAKYDSTGHFEWVKAAGACCDTTKSNVVALDDLGNIYIAGSFNDATKFGSNNFTSMGLSDIFIVKYDSTGQVVWAKQAGSTDEDIAYSLAVNSYTNTIYVTGLIAGTGQFDNITVPIAGYKDIYIAAYNTDGDAMWVTTHGGHLRDVGSAIAVNRSGFIYNTGLFNDVAAFGPFTLNGYLNEPWADFYVDKIAPPVAQMPGTYASSLSVTPVNCSDLSFSFTPGGGDRRLIIARQGSPVNAFPVNGQYYNADNVFGNGSNLGNGNFVVYDGSGNEVTVTGLTPGTQYYFTAVEYNGYGYTSNYNTNGPPMISAQTATYSINVSGLQSSICVDDTLTLLASGAVSYSWSPSSGLSSSSGAMIYASPAATTTYTVSGLNYNGCNAESQFTIQVNPLPVITFITSPVCVNNPPVSLGASPAGGIYSGTGISGNQFDPVISGPGNFALLYTYTSSTGCTSDATSYMLVNPLPNVSMSPLPAVCENSPSFTLNNGSPAGGYYTGNGVTGVIFNPSVGSGSYPITYSYIDNNGCSSSAIANAVVHLKPAVTIGNDTVLCAEDAIVLSAGGGFSSYLWSNGSSLSSLVVDSGGTGLGTRNVFVEVSNTYGCINRDSVNITFDLCAGIESHNQQHFPVEGVYPNPFQKDFMLAASEKVSIRIYDLCGRVIDRKDNITGSILVGSEFSSGTYYIEVITDHSKKVFPVIKAN